MLTLATFVVVVIMPASLVVAALLAVGRMERARDARIARQVAVTDAIHRELGAVVAPVVTGRLACDRVEIAVPFQSPAIVSRVVAIAHATMLRTGGSRRFEIVLAAQVPEPRPNNVRTLNPVGPSPLPASERETMAWTSTTTSRAV